MYILISCLFYIQALFRPSIYLFNSTSPGITRNQKNQECIIMNSSMIIGDVDSLDTLNRNYVVRLNARAFKNNYDKRLPSLVLPK